MTSRRLYFMSIRQALALCLALSALLAVSCSPGQDPDAGRAMPALELPDLLGRPVSLQQFSGRVIMLNFWATWCGPCRDEVPEFVELQKEYGPQGLSIVAVSLDEKTPDEVSKFAGEFGINFQVLYAGSRKEDVIGLMGGISGIPTTFLIDRRGVIVRRVTGRATKELWKGEIEKLL